MQGCITKRLTHQAGVARITLRCEQVVKTLRDAVGRIEAQMDIHQRKKQSQVKKRELMLVNAEYLALKNGLYDHADYRSYGKRLSERQNELSEILSANIDDTGELVA